ncbi:MAG: hypothetical protein JXR37_07035 [Kiritimatiellae bacterium]|nr:hypothetical protein [Kiritimatiellia bacterium]
MGKRTDVHVTGAELYVVPVEGRLRLKFGKETPKKAGGSCIRVRLRVADAAGRAAEGWGETPRAVLWSWPSETASGDRADAMGEFCRALTKAWAGFDAAGHPLEIGHAFLETRLPALLEAFNATRTGKEPMPRLAALVCNSAFDQALHDAYGVLLERPTYETYNAEYMNRDLAAYLTPAPDANVAFENQYPEDFFVRPRPDNVPAWHLVGGLDALDPSELTGTEPDDGVPVLLPDWIKRDGLKCLKIKLRGNDPEWDYDRIVRVTRIGKPLGVTWLTADFNCTVSEPGYVNAILDRLMREEPAAYQMILYVEQPFPYDLEKNQIDVHSVSARKPLFMDESAHDWRIVQLGRQLGWTGVALKTCKTQTGALLSLCWAKAHGMTLMVQDLTNPMLAQIPHVLLCAYAGTIMGVETNSMQFHAPGASAPEKAVHPGLYDRRDGMLDLSTVSGPGFGYRIGEIERALPQPIATG